MVVKSVDTIKYTDFIGYVEANTNLFALDLLGYPWYQNAIELINNAQSPRMSSSLSPSVAERRQRDFASKRHLLNMRYNHVFLLKSKQRRGDLKQVENFLFHDLFLYLKESGENFLILEMPEKSDVYDNKYLDSQFADVTLPFEQLIDLIPFVVESNTIKKTTNMLHEMIGQLFNVNYSATPYESYIDRLKQSYEKLAGNIPTILFLQQLLQQVGAQVFYGSMGTHYLSGLNNQWSVVEVGHGYSLKRYSRGNKCLNYMSSHFCLDKYFYLAVQPKEIMTIHHNFCLKHNIYRYGLPELRHSNVSANQCNSIVCKFGLHKKKIILVATINGKKFPELKKLMLDLQSTSYEIAFLIRQHPVYDQTFDIAGVPEAHFVNDENLYALLTIADVVITPPSTIVVEAAALNNKIILYPISDENSEKERLQQNYPIGIAVLRLEESALFIKNIIIFFEDPTKASLVSDFNPTAEITRLLGQAKVVTGFNHEFMHPQCRKDNIDLYLVRLSILQAIKGFLPQCKGTFLDIGCGEMPYKQLIISNPDISLYIGMDIENHKYQKNVQPNLFWDGQRIPLNDNTIDCAMATELFEHLPDIQAVLLEIQRILKPGGKLFFTVPFLWPLHDMPQDECRYTPFSLQRFFQKVGFVDINIKALGGWDASLAQMIGLWLKRRPMDNATRQEFMDLLFPFYKELLALESDGPHLTLEDMLKQSTMITGVYGTTTKTHVPLNTSVKCPVCDSIFEKFQPYGVIPRQNALCPTCNSLERHRLLWLYLHERTNLFTSNLTLLEIAPWGLISEKIRSLQNIDYLSIDKNSSCAMINMDITELHFPDNFFDSILCYHVLEHVPDDYKALHELHRVLKPGGWAILQVPLKSGPTIEGIHIIDPEERTRLFGQADHVRYYGNDYKQRLESKGFIVRVDSYAAELPLAVRIRNALPMEDIYYCTKPVCC